MRRFIKYFILFSLPVLFLGIFLEYSLRNIPNDYRVKREYLDKSSSKIEVLYLGNSHVYFGVNPNYLRKKSYNAAHISQSLNYDLAILEKYQSKWNSLEFIVVPIDYFSMYSTIETGVEKWRIKNYYIYYGISQNGNYWDNFELFNGKLGVNLSRLNKFLFKGKSSITCDSLGWGITYTSRNSLNLNETGKVAAKRHTIKIRNNPILLKNMEIINSIIKFGSIHNVKILFVTSPAYKSYTQNLDREQLDKTVKWITRLSQVSPNTIYHNFLNDKSFIGEDFYDADHLNEIGAKKLTLKIDSILNKY